MGTSKKGKPKGNAKGSAKSGGFQSLGLSKEVFRAVMKMGYSVPTPIQRKALPLAMAGRDVVAMARTGSGKTAAFIIPMLERLKSHSAKVGARALVLSPTRELALQTLRFTKQLGKFMDLKSSLIVGGDSMEQQFDSLASNPDILIATPGRLAHHLNEVPDFNLKSVEFLVFDEADRLFEMGFQEQINEIIRGISENRQTLLFSATMPKVLVSFARAGLRDPELIRLDTDTKISENLKMAFFTVRSTDKAAAFLYLIREIITRQELTIVFAATKHHVEFLHELLKAANIDAAPIYGEMDQSARKINLGKFRAKKTSILLVTDVAARGIDIPLLNNVVNYNFPATAKLFVHRVGRAARAGRMGTAFTFVEPDEVSYMIDLHLFLGRSLRTLGTKKSKQKTEREEMDQKSDSKEQEQPAGYKVTDMKPDDVHYGRFPQSVLDRESEAFKEMVSTSHSLSSLIKVCENAQKQYARTRTDPSKQSIRRAKELPVEDVHPLLLEAAAEDQEKTSYLSLLRSFRPQNTIFEVSTGPANQAKKDSVKVQMMKAKRRQHDGIIQYRSEKRQRKEEEELTTEDARNNSNVDDEGTFEVAVEHSDDPSSATGHGATNEPKKEKVYLSKADRKKLKKGLAKKEELIEKKRQHPEHHSEKTTFRDEDNFISLEKNGTENSQEESSKLSIETRLEEAVLDLIPEDVREMNEKRRVMHWDKRKRKYVQMTVGELKRGEKGERGGKKQRLENGQKVKELKAGQLYKKWQEKNHRKIAREGLDEEPEDVSIDKPSMKANRKVKDELKSESVIRKEQKKKEKLREKHGRHKKGKGGEKRGPTGGSATKKKKAPKFNGARSRSKMIVRK